MVDQATFESLVRITEKVINDYGLDNFKKTSMFASNSRLAGSSPINRQLKQAA